MLELKPQNTAAVEESNPFDALTLALSDGRGVLPEARFVEKAPLHTAFRQGNIYLLRLDLAFGVLNSKERNRLSSGIERHYSGDYQLEEAGNSGSRHIAHCEDVTIITPKALKSPLGLSLIKRGIDGAKRLSGILPITEQQARLLTRYRDAKEFLADRDGHLYKEPLYWIGQALRAERAEEFGIVCYGPFLEVHQDFLHISHPQHAHYHIPGGGLCYQVLLQMDPRTLSRIID